jgi:hypothetical protein
MKKFENNLVVPVFRRSDETKEAGAHDSIHDETIDFFKPGVIQYQFGTQSWQTFRLPPYEFDMMDEDALMTWSTPKKEDKMDLIETRYKTKPLDVQSNLTQNPKQLENMKFDAKLKNYSISPKYKFPMELRQSTEKLVLDFLQSQLMNENKVSLGILSNKWRRHINSRIENAPNITFPSHKLTLVYMAWFYGIYDMAIDTFPFICYDLFKDERVHEERKSRKGTDTVLSITDTIRIPSK